MRPTILLAAALSLAALPRDASAQVPNRESAAEVRKQFLADLDGLQSKFLALAEAFPAEKYSWRPAPGVRSVGEVFMHVASEYYVYTPMAYGAARSPVVQQGQDGLQKFEQMSSKAEVLQHLQAGFVYMKQQLTGIEEAQLAGAKKLWGADRTIIETSFGMSSDLHEHLGQLIAYARVNGIKPPWTK
jgi:hypothetical protein